jgi:2-oxoglutarate ferredoxin oxidoreductase subunit gamma
MVDSQVHEVMLAGHGGQGIISTADLVGTAANAQGLRALCRMVYGAEMRGGIVECTLIVSPDEILSPVVTRPKAVLAMNADAWRHFGHEVAEGGVAVANSSIVTDTSSAPAGVRVIDVPCVEIADELGAKRTATVVGLGALVEATGMLPLEAVEDAFAVTLPERHHKLIPVNVAALRAGAERARHVLDAQPVG